ncbi:hypothetical protein NEUTE1DRAFT_138743 [Neurospora tetrasperma FGSC 2508]|uniref:Uncharacterized protein n=1 Tax=Neurospora tetrasperma (strain FGSC 2508 / ATCC MYA-4615 / P0657) TaxID=510951 RepID=F8MQK3_NEUT8|nr:uncharacterized protein NEUTE1DRAFT_138743 [Neurospora tetrasperma FGSC 2508]EGO56633.1 hypothetical protein NEUTE1DRAFT_138743 [Neurospora tetrasperma FGSC 2508]
MATPLPLAFEDLPLVVVVVAVELPAEARSSTNQPTNAQKAFTPSKSITVSRLCTTVYYAQQNSNCEPLALDSEPVL